MPRNKSCCVPSPFLAPASHLFSDRRPCRSYSQQESYTRHHLHTTKDSAATSSRFWRMWYSLRRKSESRLALVCRTTESKSWIALVRLCPKSCTASFYSFRWEYIVCWRSPDREWPCATPKTSCQSTFARVRSCPPHHLRARLCCTWALSLRVLVCK